MHLKLSFREDNPLNTVIMYPDGRPLYAVNTPYKFFGGRTATLTKFDGSTSVEVASVKWHTMDDAELRVNGRSIMPRRSGMFSVSETFKASDGKHYKWKVDGRSLRLISNDGSHKPIAVFLKSSLGIFSTPRLAYLSIAPAGMPILDDIVTTFVYMEQERRNRDRSSNTAIPVV